MNISKPMVGALNGNGGSDTTQMAIKTGPGMGGLNTMQ